MNPARPEDVYRERIARVLAAIVRAPMDPHRLEDLAALAHFSPFHFHRIYRSVTGETVAATIRRLRLACASRELGLGRRPVTAVALEAGYDSPQAFSRAFRSYAGTSPRAFRDKLAGYGGTVPSVRLETVAPQDLCALPHHGPPATIPHTHRRLRRLLGAREAGAWLGLSYGDAEAPPGFRYYVAAGGLAGPPPAPTEALALPGGLYAVHRLVGPYTQIDATITALYGLWLPGSGYQPDHRPTLERYLSRPQDTPPQARVTELMIPLRALA